MPTETMLFEINCDVLFAVHSASPPSDAEWVQYLELTAPNIPKLIANIVLTDGGGPNASQRKLLAPIPGLSELPTAVVTRSAIVRGIITAISWGGKNIRSFHPEAVEQLFDYAKIPGNLRPKVLLALATMKARLAGYASLEQLADNVGGPSEIGRIILFAVTEPLSKLRATGALPRLPQKSS